MLPAQQTACPPLFFFKSTNVCEFEGFCLRTSSGWGCRCRGEFGMRNADFLKIHITCCIADVHPLCTVYKYTYCTSVRMDICVFM